jgi:hypothetical protein
MRQFMLSGARWAKRHRPAAISLITLAKILIGIVAFNLGVYVLVSGITIPTVLKWPFAAAGVVALLSYPTQRLKSMLDFEGYFLKQKRTDLFLAGLGIFLWFFIGNQTAQWAMQPTVIETVTTSSVRPANGSLIGHVKGWATPERTRGLAKYTQKKFKQHIIRKIEAWGKQSDDATIAIQILLTLLSIVLLIVLAYLVGILACNLSCSGNDTAAALVLILGWGGLLVGFFFAMKAIWWDYRRRGQSSGIDERHKRNGGIDERHKKNDAPK